MTAPLDPQFPARVLISSPQRA